ncbi:hypothetical protein HMPREF0239_04863 [Clostridium sp. ATCC BAA-442]|nr:hypothetical protein HMPREF0239_04863 [Clostridium sp. ATCC BAA-442]
MRRAPYGTFSTHRVTAHSAYHSFSSIVICFFIISPSGADCK